MTTTAADSPTTTKRPRRRRRTPVPAVLQMEVTECGAASLGMVLAHYGKFVSLEDLRITCGVARDGSTARNIYAAARAYGLEVRAYRREPANLKDLTFPLIVHWRFAHFLVVEGWYPGGWYLNDPAMGPRRCDDQEFDECFTGVVLEFTPGPDFLPGGSRPGVLGRLLRAAGNINPILTYVAMLALLLLVPTLVVPQIVRLFGNQLAGAAGLAASVAVVGLLMATGVQAALLWLQGSLSVKMATKVSVRLGSAMVYRLLRLPAAFHAQRGAAALTQRAVLADQLSNGVSALAVTAATGILTSAAGAVALVIVDPPTGVLAIVIGLAAAWSMNWTMKRSRDEAARVVRETVEVGAVMSSSLNQIESIKAGGNEDGIIARGLAAQNRLLEAQQRIGVRSLLLTLLPSVLTGTGTVLIAALGAWRVLQNAVSPGTFLAILTLSAVVIAPLTQVVIALDMAQTLRATLDQVDDVLRTPEDPEYTDVPSGDLPAVLQGDLRLVNVTFGYSRRSSPVITDLNLHIAPGHRVALVGPSGCGKSTAAKLVTGLYAPWSGEVLIDGKPRSAHARDVLTDQIALVDQDVSVFAGTFRDNVTLWDPTIPDEDVRAAILDAQLGPDVARRPGGLDAVLTEGGADLSGGQRQRLEIARALVRNPALLVMDEATSALDPLTEQAIDEAVRRRGISCLVIAHRLSTIRDSDEIVVLSEGSVVERGTHEQLLAAGGSYAALVGSA